MHDQMPSAAGLVASDPDADWGLPGWTYHDPDFFDAEMAAVIRPSWQIVCHESDLARPGDWRSIDYVGESIIVVRGEDGVVRGFTNVCRHRAMRLLDGAGGCAKKIICRYHAWAYELDGRLTGVPESRDYPMLDKANQGLSPVGLEIWRGFVFVRLEDDGGPSVAAMMAPYEHEIEPYRFADLRTITPAHTRPRAVNWKNIGDNYSDNLHIPVAHPGLTRLFGKSYAIAAEPYVDKMSGYLVDKPSVDPWERFYQTHLPHADHLPEANQRLWLYYKLWPNIAFDIYPDQVDFMQWLPTGPTSCIIREISYVIPDARREMRAARYLNWRINRQVNAEDTVLITRVQHGMASQSFTMGPLSDKEVCLKQFCRRMRELIPEARSEQPPAAGWSR